MRQKGLTEKCMKRPEKVIVERLFEIYRAERQNIHVTWKLLVA